MKRLLTILFCFIAFQTFAMDFHVSFLKDYGTLVYGKVYMSSGRNLELEILDTIVLNGTEDIKKGLKLTIPHYNYQYELSEEREAVLALRYENSSWLVERIFMGKKKDDFILNLKNKLSSISITVQEFAEGLKLLYTDLNIDLTVDRSVNYAYNLGKVTLKVNKKKFKQDLLSNAFLNHLFKEWDYFQCSTTDLGFGFWHDLASKKDSLIAANAPAISIPFINQHNKTNELFSRFQVLDSADNVLSDYAYFFNPLIDTFHLVYKFTPDNPIKRPVNTAIITYSNYGFIPYRTLETHNFGDYYFPDNSMFELGTFDSPQIVLPQYDSSGIIHFYTKTSDSLIAKLTNGQFTGRMYYYTPAYYYEKNFNELGQAHGAFAIYTKEMGKLLFYQHFTANAKSGHYYSTFPSGKVYLTGSYYNNRRIGEWIEYYPQEYGGGIKSKNNYTYYDNSIYNEVSSNWTNPKILSNRCIDDENIRSLNGYQIYFDADGRKLSFQQWKNGELLARQDWYRKTLNSEIGMDSLGGIILVNQDTIYHTSGQYKNNQPWSGTFLAGAHNYHGGSASGRGPRICICIERYQGGIIVKTDTIFDNKSSPYIWEEALTIQGKNLTNTSYTPKKKGIFKKKKKHVRSRGGDLIEKTEKGNKR